MMSSIAAWFDFEEIKIGVFIFLLTLVPFTSVTILLQLFVPTAEVNRIIAIEYSSTATPNPEMYIFYLISAVAQVIVTMLVIIMLRRRLRENISEPKRKAIEIGVYSFVVVILAMFVIADSFDPVLARLSHERVYRVLEHSPLFSPYFRSFPGVLFGSNAFPGIYLFSFLSGIGIVLALVVIVLTCFNLGRDLAVVRNAINDQQLSESQKQDLDSKIQAFQSYVYVLSAVLMTSTIGTGLFFRLPLTSIAPGEAYGSFQNISTAMTVCWGVTFSLTMLTMCFYPYFRIQKDLRTLRREGKVANDTEFTRWLDDLQKEYVVYTNVKSLLTIFLPALIAVLSRFV
ncbi:MAG TPA: hypothetical protein VE863_01210 [Pyrinomonadaceae bacterium]|jgi:sterol desaturase/sphingolipid hydroxylase (fatty acid hydroxylase superfamily)|nr:hypothetical protein [Pyrinomonadaceae bacterium]